MTYPTRMHTGAPSVVETCSDRMLLASGPLARYSTQVLFLYNAIDDFVMGSLKSYGGEYIMGQMSMRQRKAERT